MLIIRPAPITDTALMASTVADDPAPWSAAVTYALGDRVQDPAAHRQYESAQANNLGHPLTDGTMWLDAGPTNRWAMFDDTNGSQTIVDGSLQVDLLVSSRVDAVAILNAQAAKARVIARVGNTVVYDKTYAMMATAGIDNWFSYFFEPIERQSDLILTDLPTYSNMAVRIILTNPGGSVKVGTLVIGQTRDLGITLMGMSVGIVDYSKKGADDFGNYVLVKRAFSKKVEARVVVDSGAVDSIVALLAQLRATPIVWVASDYASGFVFGFYKDFTTTFDYPGQCVCLLEIEGLT